MGTRWVLLALCLAGACGKSGGREEQLSADRKTYSIVEHEGTTTAPELYRKAAALLAHHDTKAACKLYQEAVALEPGKPMGYIGLAACAIDEHRLDEARRLYEKAAALDGSSSAAPTGLATVATLEGRRREAVALYEKALVIDEKNADAHWGAAMSYEALGEPDKMRAHAARFVALAPSSQWIPLAKKMLQQP
jgi:tetratricopeptide (TPR) repeat protein